MGMFGSIGAALKKVATPENIYLMGAGLKDASAGGSDNLVAAQKLMDARQTQALKLKAQQNLRGLFGGQAGAAGAGGSLDLSNPETQRQLFEADLAGINIAPLVQMGTASQADLGQASDGSFYNKHDRGMIGAVRANRAPVANTIVDLNDTNNTNRVIPEAPVKGAMPVYDNLGRVTDWNLPSGAQTAIGAASQAQQTGQTLGNVYNRPNGDGSTTPVMGAQMFGGGSVVAPGGIPRTGGQAPAAAPRTLTPGEIEAQKVDFTSGAQTVAGAGDAKIKAANNARQYGTALDMALSLDPNNLTGVKLGLAKSLRSVGYNNPNLEQFVGTAEGMRQLTTQLVLPMAKELGANPSNKDAEIIMKSQPGLTTPKQVAVVTFASNAALANKEAARQDFYASYEGPQSKAAMQKAWKASPQSAVSIYQDPVWQKIQINGKPAVQIFDQPYKDGKKYGIFMPGTKRAQIFEVH